MFRFTCLLSWLTQIGMALVLSRWLGVGAGLAFFAVTVLAISLFAGFLLKTAPDGETSWRNVVAGVLLPWAVLYRPSRLSKLILKNVVTGMVVAGLAVGCDGLDVFEPVSDPQTGTYSFARSMGTTVLILVTAAGWAILSAGWVMLLMSHFRNRSEPISTLVFRKGKVFPLIFPPLAIGISIAFRFRQWYWLSFLTVWGPLLMVFLPVILMALAIFIHTLQGKPIRWN